MKFFLVCFLMRSQEIGEMMALPDLFMFLTILNSSVTIKGGTVSIEATPMSKCVRRSNEMATDLATASI